LRSLPTMPAPRSRAPICADHGADACPRGRRAHRRAAYRAGQLVMAAPGHTLLLIPNAIQRRRRQARDLCDPRACPSSAARACRAGSGSRARRKSSTSRRSRDEVNAVAEQVRPSFRRSSRGRRCCTPSFLYQCDPSSARAAAQCRPPESTGATTPLPRRYHAGVGRLIDALDGASRGQAALGSRSSRCRNSFSHGIHQRRGTDGGTAYDVFHNSEPNRWIKAPASIDHRFFNEDVPYGLLAIAELVVSPACRRRARMRSSTSPRSSPRALTAAMGSRANAWDCRNVGRRGDRAAAERTHGRELSDCARVTGTASRLHEAKPNARRSCCEAPSRITLALHPLRPPVFALSHRDARHSMVC
jgi:hypothetical protein